MKKLLALVVVAAIGAGAWFVLRDRNHSTPATTAATTTPGPTIPVQAYFYLGAELVPVVVEVPKTGAVATAALRALLAGPPARYRTAVPTGAALDGVTIAAGTAHARVSALLANAPRTAQAQIVYTLTQFPSVSRVDVDAAGAPVPLMNGADATLPGPATRADYADLTESAPIFVSAPVRDSTVSSPIRVFGTASVFEGTIALGIWHAGKLLATRTITASSGAPQRGPFSDTFGLPAGRYKLVFYEPSAADGSPLHETTVDITVSG